jgi:hypothetical protein
MGQVEVKIEESAVLASDPKWAALKWLVRFIEAKPEELPGLLSLKSGFGNFQHMGVGSTKRREGKFEIPLWPPKTPAELEGLKSFHAQFVKVIRAVLEGGGVSMGEIKLPPNDGSSWRLFCVSDKNKSAARLRSYFEGSWELGFLSRAQILLACFDANLKLCPQCSKVFAAEHGLQNYCSRTCSDRKRLKRFRAKKAAADA